MQSREVYTVCPTKAPKAGWEPCFDLGKNELVGAGKAADKAESAELDKRLVAKTVVPPCPKPFNFAPFCHRSVDEEVVQSEGPANKDQASELNERLAKSDTKAQTIKTFEHVEIWG